MDEAGVMALVGQAVADARAAAANGEQLLAALSALHALRVTLAEWEPELITAARMAGVSWAALAPALGVASRQAAERRYLRLQPSTTGEATGEGRIDAQRDRRAGDRAVSEWARRNAVVLRQLAARITVAEGMSAAGRRAAAGVAQALAADDASALLEPLAAARRHLVAGHADLAGSVGDIGAESGRVRDRAISDRRRRTTGEGPAGGVLEGGSTPGTTE
ncbi:MULTISPECIES: HSP18 transcriptional regulator [unclassified Amycolatopsis]|uniref:HSP18 transcriptional regulator n=1 Tax=unclassified Amycolatopsis TaxID=2618356 RepID=UPI001C69DA68|nr:HSP18 transcriptional regulator [Amycolatopsis sp. DSM 110486]QYN19105.1 HSP18 transcriptional regulator [Amycolatopsis sp. DSM 110486]